MRHTSEWQYTHNERVSISDEKPLHMRPQLDCIRVVISRVSNSDEKPLHMPHRSTRPLRRKVASFNLRREAAPHATQSSVCPLLAGQVVSISDEKPLHMRLQHHGE